jgi:hypothetical protein
MPAFAKIPIGAQISKRTVQRSPTAVLLVYDEVTAWSHLALGDQSIGARIRNSHLPESDLIALGLGEPNNRYMMESRAGPLWVQPSPSTVHQLTGCSGRSVCTDDDFAACGPDSRRRSSQMANCRHNDGSKCEANSRFISKGRQ